MKKTDKTCVITGANSGIGKALALGMARQGWKVIMVCRDKDRGETARQEIISQTGNKKIDLLLADLSRQDEISRLSSEIRQSCERLDVLLLNAGAMFVKKQISSEGIEATLAVNHFGPMRLCLMLEELLKSSKTRVISVNSAGHKFADPAIFKDLDSTAEYQSMRAYGNSKLCNLLFVREYARQLQGTGVTVNAYHPGFVRTNIGLNNTNSAFIKNLYYFFTGLIAVSPEAGADTGLYLALSDEVKDVTGEYFVRRKIAPTSAAGRSREYARILWDYSLKKI